MQIKNIKLELGTIATPWIPNRDDAKYSTMGLDDGVYHDVSGFKYNANVLYGSITHSSDTPKYNTSCVFDGASAITLDPALYQ